MKLAAKPVPSPVLALCGRRDTGKMRAWAARVFLAACLLPTVSATAADLPWLPPRASGTVAVELGEASAESFHVGTEEVELEAGAIETEVQSFRLTYSLSDNFAIDASLGQETGKARALGTVEGETGFGVGLIWRPVNEQFSPGAPSVALRVGWFGEGGYDAEQVHAPGPGTGGYDASVSIGRVFREALSLSASFGGRVYEDPIPAVVSAEVSAALLSQPASLDRILGGMEGGVILRASYRREFSTGDHDVADPYRRDLAGRFPELAREYARGAVGMAVAAGPMEVAAEAFRYMGGRNVGNFTGATARITLKADLRTLLGLL